MTDAWQYLLICVVAFTVGGLIIASERWHGRFTGDSDLDKPQASHTRSTPRIGGLAVFAGTLAEGLVKLLGEIACKCVFKTETIYRMEVKEAVMLDNLLDRFVGAAIKYDDPTQKLNSIEERLISFISNNYKKAYRYHAEEKSEVYRLYLRLLLVTDYICGMTDSYAKRLYQELNAIMA